MTKKYLLLFTILINSLVFAQYPYEKNTAIKYLWKGEWKAETGGAKYSSVIPNFFDGQALKIVMTSNADDEVDDPTIKIEIFSGKKLIQTLNDKSFAFNFSEIYTADFNSDGFKDIKFEVWTGGVGLGALSNYVYYLFGTKDKKFDGFTFYNMDTRKEYDFNKDGNFEIIHLTHESINDHSYWVYNLYNYVNGQLKNVGTKYNYPIFIQHLIKDNYKPSENVRKKYSKEYFYTTPEEYHKLF